MAVRRRRGARTPRKQWSNVWWALPGLVIGVAVFVFSLINFIEGRYLIGRNRNEAEFREAWEAYGPGAYSGESPIHLLVAGGAVAFIVLAVGTLRGSIRGRPVDYRVVGWIAAGIVSVAAAATLVLLIGNWSRGTPMNNFRPVGADGLMYALWCVIPLMVLGAVGYAVVDRVRKHLARDRPSTWIFADRLESSPPE